MITVDFPYVQQRNRGFRYRRVIPADVRVKFENRQNWTKAWRRGTPLTVIEFEARQLAVKHDRLIAEARGQEAEGRAREWLDGDPADLAFYLTMLADTPKGSKLSPQIEAVRKAIAGGGRLPVESPPLSAALARDVEVYGGERNEKPARYAVATFVDVVGEKSVTAITRADVSEWITAQATGGLAPATIKRRLGALRALLNRQFLDMDYPGRNPFEKQPIKGGNGGASDILPFNREMITLIDSHLNTGKRVGRETRNILRIMRNTSGGPAEIGGAVLANVSLDSEIPYIWIRPNHHRRLKVAVRDRQIPLIGLALEAATDAVERAMARVKGGKKNTDTVPLFEDFGMNGRGADAISRKCNVCIRTAGVPRSPRLVAYSYRHTLKEALRSAGVLNHVQDRIMGHSGEGQISARYGSPRVRLSEARDALVAAMEYLGDIDPSIYSEQERMK